MQLLGNQTLNRHATSARILIACAILIVQAAVTEQSRAGQTVFQVGPTRDITRVEHAAQIAKDGDRVEIDAGTYTNDHAIWQQSDLTIVGVGGMAHLRSSGFIANGKATWIVTGDNVTIENIEFSGAQVADGNGAGIRHQGGNLTLRNTFFHHNEFSLLTGPNPDARITVRDSRFWHQRRQARWSHGIYVGAVGRLTLSGNHFLGTDKGHQVKSRALENLILYNRIEDIPGGSASRLIDLPNCGLSFVVGNQLHQASSAGNLDIIGYGMEGCDNRTPRQRQLFVVHNTLINEARSGTLAATLSGGTALVQNNLGYGTVTLLRGKGREVGNLTLPLSRVSEESKAPSPPQRWRLEPPTEAVDAALALPEAEPQTTPQAVFNPPAGTSIRQQHGQRDIGALETAAGDH